VSKYERLCMDVLMEYVPAAVYMFDGILTEQTGFDLEYVAIKIQEKVDISVRLAEKHIPTIEFEELDYRSPHGIFSSDKVVLFGLHGTLASANALRPFLPDISKLKTVFKIGLYVDTDVDSNLLRTMQESMGTNFDFILTAEHCVKPSETYRLQHGLKPDEKIKPLHLYFENLNNVIIVDSAPSKILPEEHWMLRRVTPWESDPDDKELRDVVASLLERRANVITYEREDMVAYRKPDGTTGYSIHPITFEENQKLALIKASMGAGKTRATKNFVTSQSTLVVTCRVAHAATMQASFPNFFMYNNLPKDVKITDCRQLICQFESLHRLVGANTYDLIVIDEIRSVCQQTVWTENKHVVINNQALSAFIKYAKHCIFLDAHVELDDMVLDYVKEHFKEEEYVYHRYMHNALDRTFVECYHHDMVLDMIARLNNREKVFACFRSKRDLLEVVEHLAQHARTHAQLLFYSGQDDSHVKKFVHINEEITNIAKSESGLLCCITSKVTVGADIQILFDKVFVFAATKGGCTPRDIDQMSKRVRRVVDTNISICLPPPERKVPTFDSTFRRKVMQG
jgi:hypothetical protein